MTAGGASGTPVVTVNLLSLGRFWLLPGEVRALFSHRHMLSAYVATLFMLVGLDFNGASGRLQIELRGTIYILAMFSALLTLALALELALFVAARRGRLTLHLSPVLMLATLCSVIVGESLFRFLVPPTDASVLRLVLLFAFHYIVAEFAAAGLAHKVLPTVLAELRGLPVTTLAETDPALWADESLPAPRPRPEATGFLTSGDRSIPLRGLVHLQADGNYVHLWATDRHELLPGPLADLVGQIPPETGRLVHRSHWVSAASIKSARSQGREITLVLSNGETVPVAVTRRREVRDWLTALSVPLGGVA